MKKFTLIELLLVVAIIGILASMMMPALSKARETTKAAVCKSNLKQIGLLVTIYENGNDGFFPLHTLTTPWRITWDDRLSDYDGRNLTLAQKTAGKLNGSDFDNNPGVYACPSDDIQRMYGTDDNNLTLSYAASTRQPNWGAGYLGITGWDSVQSVRVDAYADPYKTLLISENKLAERMLGRSWTNVIHAQSQWDNLLTIPHKGDKGSNILHGDRSVSMISLARTIENGSFTNTQGTMWDVLKE